MRSEEEIRKRLKSLKTSSWAEISADVENSSFAGDYYRYLGFTDALWWVLGEEEKQA